VHVNPAGETTEVRATVPEKPGWPDTLMTEVAGLPVTMVMLAGLALREKSVTVSWNVAVLTTLSGDEVPVIVTVTVPSVAAPLAVKVKVEEQVGLQLVGLKADAVTPVGKPEMLKVTG